jgi:cytochrome c5
MEGKVKRNWALVASFAFIAAILPLAGEPSAGTPVPQVAPVKTNVHAAPSSDGERVFQQNCSRCHDAPQSFSPRISGTVIRHMRVRASLSEKDEKALLKFLNP